MITQQNNADLINAAGLKTAMNFEKCTANEPGWNVLLVSRTRKAREYVRKQIERVCSLPGSSEITSRNVVCLHAIIKS